MWISNWFTSNRSRFDSYIGYIWLCVVMDAYDSTKVKVKIRILPGLQTICAVTEAVSGGAHIPVPEGLGGSNPPRAQKWLVGLGLHRNHIPIRLVRLRYGLHNIACISSSIGRAQHCQC